GSVDGSGLIGSKRPFLAPIPPALPSRTCAMLRAARAHDLAMTSPSCSSRCDRGGRSSLHVCFEFSLRGWCGAQPRLGLPTLGVTAEGAGVDRRRAAALGMDAYL